MKVLVIDEWIPWPLENGKKIRSFNLITRLSLHHEIIYLSYVNISEDMEKITFLEKLGIRVIPVKDIRTKKWTPLYYTEILLNFISKNPFWVSYYIKDPLIEEIQRTVKKEKPDIIHYEWSILAPLIKYTQGIPSVIATHNIESYLWKRLAENTTNFFMRYLGNHQAKKLESFEREWYPKANHCTAVSLEDQKVIESYGARVTLVENGVDIQYYNIAAQNIDSDRLIFVASFDTLANQDAVDFFIKQIFPHIKSRHPRVNFWAIGKEPPQRIRNYALQDSQIHVTGTVSDVRALISQAAICVVPIRIGGGSRLKILEAMAMKKPVVSTTVGAEGLRVKDGENILLADDPEDFAAKVSELLLDPDRQKSLGQTGWDLVSSSYNWERLAEKQDNVWQRVLLS